MGVKEQDEELHLVFLNRMKRKNDRVRKSATHSCR